MLKPPVVSTARYKYISFYNVPAQFSFVR
jgi:hypothetical protein